MGKSKQGRSAAAKKTKQDTFLKKEWRRVYIPGISGVKNVGHTILHRPARGKQTIDYVNKRIFEVAHIDMVGENGCAERIYKWQTVSADENGLYTRFAGMRLSSDKITGDLRKYRTLVETSVDAKTTDDYILRVFCLTFTKKVNAHKKACYVNQSTARKIRGVMSSVMTKAITSSTVQDMLKILADEKMENAIVEECKEVFQIEKPLITKVKVLKAPALSAE